MKKIYVERIMETSYEDGTHWIEYTVDGKYGYEIVEGICEGQEKEEERKLNESKALNQAAVSKANINICSGTLAEIIEECRGSDNEMWFVEYDDIDEKELVSLEEEVNRLNLNDYITFGEDECAVTVYGGVITEFLF